MIRRAIFFSFFISIFFLSGWAGAEEVPQNPFSVNFSKKVVKATAGETFEFIVQFKIPQGYYLYDGKTSLFFEKTEGITLLKSQRPPAEKYFDPFFKEIREVHFKSFPIKVIFNVPKNTAPGKRLLEARLKYQGCSKKFCYRPVTKKISFPVEVKEPPPQLRDAAEGVKKKTASQDLSSGEERLSFSQLMKVTNPEQLLDKGKVYLLGLAFVGGVLTSFTPCVLPLIPLTLAFIGARHRRRGNLLRALTLVAGMVFMYSLLGFLAASLGLKLGFLFQSRYFVLLIALFFLVFSLGLFGVIPFHLPSKLHNKFAQMGGEGPLGTFLAGLTVGLIASPCVGPLIGPLLLIAARSQDRAYGFSLLLTYGIGMGLLFLVLASGFAEINSKLKSGWWSNLLKKVIAVLMLVPALYYGYAFAKPYLGEKGDRLWIYHFDKGMEFAKKSGKPILLDYYADWCPPCVELDKLTFSNPEVREQAKKFVMLKIDCSFDEKNCKKATDYYKVIGWPTILFLKSSGEIIEDVNVIGGFVDKDQMLELMNRALERAK